MIPKVMLEQIYEKYKDRVNALKQEEQKQLESTRCMALGKTRLPRFERDIEYYSILRDALEKQISKNPQTEPPSRAGTYLVKDRDGNYRDADWLDGKFWVKKHVSLPYEPCLIQYFVAWWYLPEVQE